MNNRNRQILRAMRMMYGKKGFRPKTPEDIRTALNDFAAGFAAGLSAFADAVNSIRLPTLQTVTFTWAYDEPTEEEKRMNRHIPCEGCKHDLGGGCCRINLETECREGGGYEAWEPKELPEPEYVPTKGETALKWFCFVLCCLLYPLAIYKIYEWVVYFLNKL